MPSSGWSWTTGTRFSLISAGRCGCTTSASCLTTGWSWSSAPTTSVAGGSCTGTSNILEQLEHTPQHESDFLETAHEGQAERQEDLQQVPDHSPARPRHGHLHRPEAQAAPGLTQITDTAIDAHRRQPAEGCDPRTEAGATSGQAWGPREGPPRDEGELPAHGQA